MKKKIKSVLLKRPLISGVIIGLVCMAMLLNVRRAYALFFTFNPLTVLSTNAVTLWPPSGYPLCVVATQTIPAHTIQVTSSNTPTGNIALKAKIGIDGVVFPIVLTNYSFINSNDTEYIITPQTTVTIYGQLEIDTTNDAYGNQLFGATIIN